MKLICALLILELLLGETLNDELTKQLFDGDCTNHFNRCVHACVPNSIPTALLSHKYFCTCRRGYFLQADGYSCEKTPPKEIQMRIEVNPSPEELPPAAVPPRISTTKKKRAITRHRRSTRGKTIRPVQSMSLPTGKCKIDSCSNGGICQNMKTNNGEYAYSCLCRLGFEGLSCQKETPGVRFPKFLEKAYLAFPENILDELNFKLTVMIKPDLMTVGAVILFKNSPNFNQFLLGIEKNNFVLRYENSKSRKELHHKIKFDQTTEKWYKLQIERLGDTAKLFVNDVQSTEVPIELMKVGDDKLFSQSSGGRRPTESTTFLCDYCLYLGGHPQLREMVRLNPQTFGFIESSFLGCMRHLTINDNAIDMRRLPFYGRAVEGLAIEECSTDLCKNHRCQNAAICLVNDAFQAECECTFGFVGKFCESRINIIMPKFNGYSYASYYGLKGSSKSDNQIYIKFKPLSSTGLLLYQGYSLDKRGDFISLYMIDGYPWVSYDLGSGAISLRSRTSLRLGEWHTLRFSRIGRRGTLTIDDNNSVNGEVIAGFSPGQQVQLTIQQDLYLGGVESFDLVSAFVRVKSGFVGCIQMLFVDNQRVRLIEDIRRSKNLENCGDHPCGEKRQKCFSYGECLPNNDEFVCSCPLGYIEEYCQTKNPISGIRQPSFEYGSGYLVYSTLQLLNKFTQELFSVRIIMNFKKMTPKNVVFMLTDRLTNSVSSNIQYFNIQTNGNQGLSVHLFNGYDYIYQDILNDLPLYSDHDLKIEKLNNQLRFVFNNSFTKEIPLTYNRITSNRFDKLFIGGVDLPSAIYHNYSVISGMYGCIKLIQIDSQTPLSVADANDGRSVSECRVLGK